MNNNTSSKHNAIPQKKKDSVNAFLTFLLCLFTLPALAQDLTKLSGYSIGFGALYTTELSVFPITPEVEGVSVGPDPDARVGYEGTLTYQKFMKRNFLLSGTFMYGAYPANINYHLKKEYVGGDANLSTLYEGPFYYKYTGFKIGLGRGFKIGEQVFSIGIKGSIVYFMGDFGAFSHYASGIEPLQVVYRENFFPNREDKVFVAPEVHLDYYKPITKRLWFYGYVHATYSSRQVVKGTYEVYGLNDTSSGEYYKRYTHVGVGVGLFYSKKR